MDNLPLMGLGTFIGIEADRIENPAQRHTVTVNTILSALRIGYRHLDLAENYQNLPAVSEALKMAFKPIGQGGLGLAREEIWLTMKANTPFTDEHLDELLARTGVSYFDLFLIHHPVADHIFDGDAELTTAWSDLANVDVEKVRRIGVSNFYQPHLTRLLAICERDGLPPPFANEVEVNVLSKNKEVVAYCQEARIQVIAYSPLGYNFSSILIETPALTELAEAIDATPAQAALACLMEQGIAVIPKSIHTERLRENFSSARYIDSMREHHDLVRTLNDQPDLCEGGLTETSVEMKTHGDQLDWSVTTPGSRLN